MTRHGTDGTPDGGRLLAVVGASGGVGTSVLATAVAVRAAAAGLDVVLVDGCPLGGGLDVVLGVEQEAGVRWPDLTRLRGAADAHALRARLPTTEGVDVLAFGRDGGEPPQEVAEAVVLALAAAADLVVVDLQAAGGAVASAALRLADRLLLVAGDGMSELSALSVVARLLAAGSGRTGARLAVALRCADGAAGAVARVVESELRWPVLCAVGHDRGLAGDLVHGVAPGLRGSGPVVRAADEVLGWATDRARGAA